MAEVAAGEEARASAEGFDAYDVPGNCRELLRRLSFLPPSASAPWKWDIVELAEESRQQLRKAREASVMSNNSALLVIKEAMENEQTVGTLPVALRQQCEELLGKHEQWLSDFDLEARELAARSAELRERLFFEDVDSMGNAGWFGAASVTSQDVQRLLDRHLEIHQRAARHARQLMLLCRSLQQQGAVSSRRRAFQARTTGEKLHSSLLAMAAAAVTPVPGTVELWLATTTIMLLNKDQAFQHVVYEHPRDADMNSILKQFELRPRLSEQSLLAEWSSMPASKRNGLVLVHNASVRRVLLKVFLVNAIDGAGGSSGDWTAAFDAHPLSAVMRKAFSSISASADEDEIEIGAQRFAMVPLLPKPDTNWGWRAVFSYGDTKVGECRLREGAVFSFICVDCGLRVADRDPPAPTEKEAVAEDSEAAGRGAGACEGGGEGEGGANILAAQDADAALAVAGAGREAGLAASFGEVGAGEAIASEVALETAAVEVANNTDELVVVKLFPHARGAASHAQRLFRSAQAEGGLGPGATRLYCGEAEPNAKTGETVFDVEIRIGNRKATCEVTGGQVIYVDGFMAE